MLCVQKMLLVQVIRRTHKLIVQPQSYTTRTGPRKTSNNGGDSKSYSGGWGVLEGARARGRVDSERRGYKAWFRLERPFANSWSKLTYV